jgi:hypothetical protein
LYFDSSYYYTRYDYRYYGRTVRAVARWKFVHPSTKNNNNIQL